MTSSTAIWRSLIVLIVCCPYMSMKALYNDLFGRQHGFFPEVPDINERLDYAEDDEYLNEYAPVREQIDFVSFVRPGAESSPENSFCKNNCESRESFNVDHDVKEKTPNNEMNEVKELNEDNSENEVELFTMVFNENKEKVEKITDNSMNEIKMNAEADDSERATDKISTTLEEKFKEITEIVEFEEETNKEKNIEETNEDKDESNEDESEDKIRRKIAKEVSKEVLLTIASKVFPPLAVVRPIRWGIRLFRWLG